MTAGILLLAFLGLFGDPDRDCPALKRPEIAGDPGRDDVLALPHADEQNWLLNAGFESGTLFWKSESDIRCHLTGSARTGKWAYALGAYPDIVRTYDIQCEKGRPVTVSWWAHRGDIPEANLPYAGGKSFVEVSFVTKAGEVPVPGGTETIEEGTRGWDRYSATAVAPGTSIRICFTGQNYILDDLQVEYGTEAGYSIVRPYGIEVLTRNLRVGTRADIDVDKPRVAEVLLRGPGRAIGSVEATVTDMFGEEVFASDQEFELPVLRVRPTHYGEQSLAIPEEAIEARGVYRVVATVTGAKGRTYGPYASLLRVFRFPKEGEKLRVAEWGVPHFSDVDEAAACEVLGECSKIDRAFAAPSGLKALFFDDGDGNCIAAIWHARRTDVVFGPFGRVRARDCAGNRVRVPRDDEKRTTLAVGLSPIYVTFDLDDLEDFISALGAARESKPEEDEPAEDPEKKGKEKSE